MQEEKPLEEKKAEKVRFEVTYCELDQRGLDKVRGLMDVMEKEMVLMRLKDEVAELVEGVLAAERFLECVSQGEYKAPLTTIMMESGIKEENVREFISSFKTLPLQNLLGADVCLLRTRDLPLSQQKAPRKYH